VKLKILIDRLKAACPSFASRVSGLSEFLMLEGREDAIATPAAYVVRLVSEVQANETVGAVIQAQTERFGVFVCVDARADAVGYDADDRLDDIRAELRSALIGWAPSADRGPLDDDGFENVTATRARVWRRFDFSTLYCE
jgi:hypothetical protein